MAEGEKELVIEYICGHEPMRNGEYPVSYQVGQQGVTRISQSMANYGDHGIGEFHIHKGDKVIATMTHRAVAEIHYQQ
jgi:hypothetical protein